MRLQDAYLGAQLLLENSASDQLFVQRMQSMTSLVGEFASERTPMLRGLVGVERLELKERMLDHYSLELCMAAAAAILYGPPEHRVVVRSSLARLCSLNFDTDLEAYPALLLRYVTGVAAVLSEDAAAWNELITQPMYAKFGKVELEIEFSLYGALSKCFRGQAATAGHEHVQAWLQPMLTILTGVSATEVGRALMQFELLYSLPKLYTDRLTAALALERFCLIYQDRSEEVSALIEQLRAQEDAWHLALFSTSQHAELAVNALERLFAETRNTLLRKGRRKTLAHSELASDAGSNEEQE